MVRPPIETSVVDAELWEQWLAFDRPVATIYRFMEQGILIREATLIQSFPITEFFSDD